MIAAFMIHSFHVEACESDRPSIGQEDDREQAVHADAMLASEIMHGLLAGRGDPVCLQLRQQRIRGDKFADDINGDAANDPGNTQ
jgi:hypothetical protein